MARKPMTTWAADYEAQAEVRCIRAPRRLSCRLRHWLIVSLDILAVLLCLLMVCRVRGDTLNETVWKQEQHLEADDKKLDEHREQLRTLVDEVNALNLATAEEKGRREAMESKEYGAWGGLAALILANLGLGLKRKRRDDD